MATISVRKCEDGTYEATLEDGTVATGLNSVSAAEMVDVTEEDFLAEFENLEGDEDIVDFDDVPDEDESGD